MSQSIETAIDVLTAKVQAAIKPEDALRITQSVLNLAHAAAVLANSKIVTPKDR